jgi:hypothetical protein
MDITLMRKKPDGAGPLPARHGVLGVCQVCHEPAATHWDTTGRFVGCTDADSGTVFVLVPAGGRPENAATISGARGAGRYRYFAAENPPDGQPRRPKAAEIYDVIKNAGPNGILKAELQAAGFVHGSIGGNCRWLRDQGYIRVEDDSDWQTWHDAHDPS